jgi:spore coat polysaccharide biosynthesis predicted glycosyltransferase SpsG
MITVVADAAPAVGMGHVSRCSAVAGALGTGVRCLGYEAERSFERDGVHWEAWNGPLAALEGVVVLDGYRFTDVEALAARTTLVLFHDGGTLPEGAALVVAPIVGVGLGGLEYACLRREFWSGPTDGPRAGILVTTGAGADGDPLAERFARELADVTVVRGPFSRLGALDVPVLDAPASLRPALLAAELVVGTGGQTSLEAAACGTPAVLIALDRAQREQAETLQRAGAARLVEPDDVAATVAALGAEERARMAAAGRAAVDGRGALRVADRIRSLPGAGA